MRAAEEKCGHFMGKIRDTFFHYGYITVSVMFKNVRLDILCLKHFSFFLFKFMDIFYLNPTSTILFAFTVTTIHQFFDLMCPVYRCLMISNLNVSSTGQRLEYHENITDTITLILCVITFRLARFYRNRLVHLNN